MGYSFRAYDYKRQRLLASATTRRTILHVSRFLSDTTVVVIKNGSKVVTAMLGGKEIDIARADELCR